MDSEEPVETTINGASNTPVVIYTRKDLAFGKHTVSVTLPNDGSHTGLQVCFAKVYGAQEEITTLEETVIPHTKTTGSTNKFTFSETGWSAGDNEHVWSDTPDAQNPSAIWYEVSFVGSKIDVYSGKNRPMGMVEYFIDNVSQGKFSLYNGSNVQSTLIATFENLGEGLHVFKAVATGEKDTNSTGTLIDCAKVVVYHTPYQVNDIILDQASYTIAEGATQQIAYTLDPDYAELNDLTYESADSTIASVSKTGTITAEGTGKTTITLHSEKAAITKTIEVNVTASTPQIGGSIVEPYTQYTQDRYDEVKNLGLMSEELTAWTNDKAISEISLYSKDSSLKNVSVTAGDFKNGEHTISADQIKTTFIKSTKAYNGSYLGYGSKDREIPPATQSNRSESNDIL